MSKISEPLYLPQTEFKLVTVALGYCEAQDAVYVQGARNNLAVIIAGFNGDSLKRVVKTNGVLSALCMRPGYYSEAFSAYSLFEPRSLSPFEYDTLQQGNFLPNKQIIIPDEFGNDYVTPWVVFDVNNNEVYYSLGYHSNGGFPFSGFVVVDAASKQYKRSIDLTALNFNVGFLSSKPSVSKHRKIFVSNGILVKSPLDKLAVFCINDVDDVFVDQILMPDIDEVPVDVISGTVVDNVRDILYVVCTADSETDFSTSSIVYAFDIMNNYKHIASSEVINNYLTNPVLNLEKRILYLVSQPSQGGTAEKIICSLVSLDLEKMNFVNSVELPQAMIDSAVHLTRSGRVGLTTSRYSSLVPHPAFFTVTDPEVP